MCFGEFDTNQAIQSTLGGIRSGISSAFTPDLQTYNQSTDIQGRAGNLARRDTDLYNQIYGGAVTNVINRGAQFGAGRLDEAQATAQKAVDISSRTAEGDIARFGGTVDPQVGTNFERQRVIDRTLAGVGARNVTRGRLTEMRDRLRSAATDYGIGFRGDADTAVSALLQGEASRNRLGIGISERSNLREAERVTANQNILGQVVGFGAGLYFGR